MVARDFDNFYITFLSQGITTTGGVNVYLDVLPTDDEGWIVLNPSSTNHREIVYYTSKGVNYVVVTAANRAIGGTTAQPHQQGAEVRMNVTAEMLEEYSEAIQPILFGKVTDAGGLDIDVAAWSGEIAGIQVAYAGDTGVTLSDNNTNYVELGSDGVLYTNTTGFTFNRKRLAIVVTSGGDITSLTDARQFGCATGPFVNSVIAGDAISVSAATGNVTFDVLVDGVTIVINGSNQLEAIQQILSGAKGDLLAGDGSFMQNLPVGTNGQFIVSDSLEALGVKWITVAPASGANNNLDNLTPTAINESLLPDTHNTLDLGSSALNWRTLYLGTSIVLQDPGAGTNAITIQSPTLGASWSLTLPVDDGTAGQVLQTNGNGATSWGTISTTNQAIVSVDTVDPDDTNPVGSAIVGDAATVTMAPGVTQIFYFDLQIPDNVDVSKDLLFRLGFDMNSSDAGKAVRWELNYNVIDDAGDTTPAAPVTVAETIITPDTLDTLEVGDLATIKIPSASVISGSTLVCKVSRLGGHVNDTHTGTMRLFNLNLYQAI